MLSIRPLESNGHRGQAESMTLIDYVDTLRRHWRLVVALTVLGAVGGYFLASTQPNMYRASATVLVSSDQAGSASDLLQGSVYVESLVTSYAAMATSELVLEPVIDELDLPTTSRGLAGSLTAESPASTFLIEIHAERGEAAEAQDLANAVADELAVAVSDVSPSIQDEPAVRVNTIQSATLPAGPFAPDERRMAAMGGAAGLLLGVAFALLLRAFGGRIRDVADATAVTTTPVLGEVVEAPRRSTLPGVVLQDPRSGEAESVRAVAANMHYLGVDGGLKSFLVTSSSPAEGKSSIACAMALILAEASARVLLVDADLRSPAIHDLTGLEPSVGLSTVLVGDVDLESAVQHWTPNSLEVLTSGPVPPNPGQLLNSDSIRTVLQQAKRQYDIVIVDTGPLALVSDAVWLGHLVDGVLVVARRGKTKTRALARVLDTLHAARTPASGVVINGGRRKRRSKYSYGYGSTTAPKQSRRGRSSPASGDSTVAVDR